MKYDKIEYIADTVYITFKNKRNGKLKKKEYSAFVLWAYHHGPNLDLIKVIAENDFDAEYAKVEKQFEQKLKEYFRRARKNWDIVCISIVIDYEVKPCREMSVNQCLDIMTPEQFLSEFRAFPQIVKEG